VHFDSNVGEFCMMSELGWPDAEYWNSQKDILEQEQAPLNRFCRYNYQVVENFTVQRRGERREGGSRDHVSVCEKEREREIERERQRDRERQRHRQRQR
jgi:hypothetical protein